jgi:hypothetical protein
VKTQVLKKNKNKKCLLASERKNSDSIHVAHQHAIKAFLVDEDSGIKNVKADVHSTKIAWLHNLMMKYSWKEFLRRK